MFVSTPCQDFWLSWSVEKPQLAKDHWHQKWLSFGCIGDSSWTDHGFVSWTHRHVGVQWTFSFVTSPIILVSVPYWLDLVAKSRCCPFTEEFAFRACMVPILLGHYSPTGAVIMSPLFFGIAHFHHMIERIRRGQDVKTAFFISSFQFAYTTVFGMYSALLFIRTGHLASCVIVHGFCNFMGFPDLIELLHQEPKKRIVLSGLFCVGLSLFYISLRSATDPGLYNNDIYHWNI